MKEPSAEGGVDRLSSCTGPDYVRLADTLKAVAHPVRMQILALLCEGDTHVNDMAERVGASQSVVSQQLRILRMNGLVGVKRERGFAIYSLAEPRLRDLLGCVAQCCHR